MDVSIGVIAHNEEKNIGPLLAALLTQQTKDISIKEIIVVSSGSTDRTDDIVRLISSAEKKIVLLRQKKRKGKFDAINLFLRSAKNDILVLMSADVLPEPDAVEKLCFPFRNRRIGIVCGHPIPSGREKTLLEFTIGLQWRIHHLMSLNKPKFGEFIAFRNIIKSIEPTSVDEECIAMHVLRAGYLPFYAAGALVYNAGPRTLHEFIQQKRRIHSGHLFLRKRAGYSPSSLRLPLLFFALVKEFSFGKEFPFCFAIALHGYTRILGFWDHHRGEEHIIWKIAPSTKQPAVPPVPRFPKDNALGKGMMGG